MGWTVVLLGQPVSGNHAYEIGRGWRKGGVSYPKLIKTARAEAYQAEVAMRVRLARPRGWTASEFVVCEYRFYLWDDADCTNLIKVIEDGIFPALGIDDTRALPRAVSKEIVPKRDARVEVTIS